MSTSHDLSNAEYLAKFAGDVEIAEAEFALNSARQRRWHVEIDTGGGIPFVWDGQARTEAQAVGSACIASGSPVARVLACYER